MKRIMLFIACVIVLVAESAHAMNSFSVTKDSVGTVPAVPPPGYQNDVAAIAAANPAVLGKEVFFNPTSLWPWGVPWPQPIPDRPWGPGPAWNGHTGNTGNEVTIAGVHAPFFPPLVPDDEIDAMDINGVQAEDIHDDILFSVDRDSTGINDPLGRSAVWEVDTQKGRSRPAGSLFSWHQEERPRPQPTHWDLDGLEIGLQTPPAPPGVPPPRCDELDAYDWEPNVNMVDFWFFYSLSPNSPTIVNNGWSGADGFWADLNMPMQPGVNPFRVPAAWSGLQPDDDIDAMVVCLNDAAVFKFSLARGSPSLAGPDGQWGTADEQPGGHI